MAENGKGVSLTGRALDEDIYGGAGAAYTREVAEVDEEDEEMDERERAVARCAGPAASLSLGGPNGRQGGPLGSAVRLLGCARGGSGGRRRRWPPAAATPAAGRLTTAALFCCAFFACSKLASYTAPKAVMSDLPVQEDGDEVRGSHKTAAGQGLRRAAAAPLCVCAHSQQAERRGCLCCLGLCSAVAAAKLGAGSGSCSLRARPALLPPAVCCATLPPSR